MKNKSILHFCFIVLPFLALAQGNMYSPYSRYGLGDVSQPTFAHNTGMGGANIALRSDSTMPIFINTGNPASYAFIRLTTLEVGGNFVYSQFKGSNTSLTKWNSNFSYGTIGFPIRNNGGACFGMMPYTTVGYETKSATDLPGTGKVEYQFTGTGGFNKVFVGYGMLPFKLRLNRFRNAHLYLPDSLRTLTHTQYLRKEKVNKIISDLSVGVNVNYIFGSNTNITRVVYPNSLLYNNTFRERTLNINDVTGNFGLQTGFTLDSVKSKNKGYKRALKEKVKFTFGYFMNVNNSLRAKYNTSVLDYVQTSTGAEIVTDTVIYNIDQKTRVRLPLEQGLGIGWKKGERINVVADFALTNWQNFKYLDETNSFKNNYRVAAGVNYVPEKYAAGRGAFGRKINYRLGVSYQTGFISINNSVISDYFVSAGIGLPVGIGRLSSMVNISAQYGRMGSNNPDLISQNYWRINFGFTFCDRWFQKFRYD